MLSFPNLIYLSHFCDPEHRFIGILINFFFFFNKNVFFNVNHAVGLWTAKPNILNFKKQVFEKMATMNEKIQKPLYQYTIIPLLDLLILMESVFVHICFRTNQMWVSLKKAYKGRFSDQGNIHDRMYKCTKVVVGLSSKYLPRHFLTGFCS